MTRASRGLFATAELLFKDVSKQIGLTFWYTLCVYEANNMILNALCVRNY